MVVRRYSTQNCFSILSLFSFSFLDCVLVMQKIILVLQFIFSFDLVSLLLFAIVLFTLIISNWILFSISSLVICFFYLFSDLVHILLIAICFVLNYFLDWFVFFPIPAPRYLSSFNFYIKFGHNSFNCYFFNYFLNRFFFYNFIPKNLI